MPIKSLLWMQLSIERMQKEMERGLEKIFEQFLYLYIVEKTKQKTETMGRRLEDKIVSDKLRYHNFLFLFETMVSKSVLHQRRL